MKNIIVRKIFRYDPTEEGKYSLYQGFCRSASQLSDPGIMQETRVSLPYVPYSIFSSPLQRARQTALLLQANYNTEEYEVMKDLKEIPFDLAALVEEKEFSIKGDSLVRQRFIEAFIADTLLESRASIQSRIENVKKFISTLPNGNYLVISHSFFMKVFEIYLKEKKVFNQPKLLRKYFKVDKKTYPFGGGFSFTI